MSKTESFLEKIIPSEITISDDVKSKIESSSLSLKLENLNKFTDDEKDEVLSAVENKIRNLPYVLSDEKFLSLDEKIQNTLQSVGVDGEDFLDLREIKQLILDKIKKIILELSKAPLINTVVIGNTVVEIPKPSFKTTKDETSFKAAGVGDLLIVKKELIGFEEGEIAHIENILGSEHKSRIHKTSTKEVEVKSYDSFTEQETLKDTQSSEQFSMEKETNNILNKQKYTDVSVGASVKYGVASINLGLKTGSSSQQSQATRNANSYAKDITERALERIVTQVREYRSTTKTLEVEETNTHGFDNSKSKDHITGIYYWVDKNYKAQTYNCGKRLMYQLFIDKPASNYIDSLIATEVIEKPIHPADKKLISNNIIDFFFGSRDPLEADLLRSFENIKENNYQLWTALYGVKDVKTYPENKIIFDVLEGDPVLDKNGGHANGEYKKHKIIKIPKGYLPFEAEYSNIGHSRGRKIIIGTYHNGFKLAYKARGGEIEDLEDGQTIYDNVAKGYNNPINETVEELPISILCDNIFTITISITCKPSDTTIENWKIETYNSIIEAYEKQKIEYLRKVADSGAGVNISGKNPAINRQIEKEEIRRACIESILKKVDTEGFNLYNDDNIVVFEKDSVDDAGKNAEIIAFMEEAFEWDQMTYEFFPYYWNQSRNDIEKYKVKDPLFQSFLRASSLKALLVVRPGFERSVMHFMVTKKLWDGKELPTITEEDVDLITEIDTMNDSLDSDMNKAETVGQSWELKVPTSLVVLSQEQKLKERTIY